MAKTSLQLSTRKDSGKTKPKPGLSKPGTTPRRRLRDLSTTFKVPEHKRLRVSQVKPITLARYSQAVASFTKWATQHRRSLGPNNVDRPMVDFLHVLCEEGDSIVTARSTVYGYIMLKLDSNLPEKLLLPQSKAALKGWSSRFPHHSRAGVDLQIWDVIAWKCKEQRDSLTAAAILLQGDTYMRPHEILHVRAGSVIKPSKSKARYWGMVIGDQSFKEPTKTGLYDDCVLLNSPGRTDLGIVLKALLAKTKTKDDFIF